MQIREATLSDIQQLTNLFDKYRIFYGKETDLGSAKAFLTERLINNDSQIFVAEKENNLVAFAQLYPLFSSTRMKRLWLLNDLYVAESDRGTGVGIKLLLKSQEFAKQTNAGGLMLETEKTNVIGNNLYPKLGFSLDQDHNNYYWEV